MLIVRDLSVYRGHIRAVDGVSFSVDAGEILVVLGANGAGKSTLLGAIAGIHPPAKGEIFLQERPLKGLPAEAVVKMGVSLVPENRQLFPSLTVRENILLGAFSRYARDKRFLHEDLSKILALFPGLEEKLDSPAHTLSGGLQQMVAIGRGLMARPRLLLMDEPSIGLAPLVVREIMQTIRHLKDQGHTVILVEQNARAALRIADRALIMGQGRIVLSGSPRALLQSTGLQSAYLGRSSDMRSASSS
ncbi:MAG: ABC transporter ATP-binding protein [Thermoanaerobacterales bacterium]|nr:ABC transporter ATP-binding protein [Thermoanaerobacterales bacterium]